MNQKLSIDVSSDVRLIRKIKGSVTSFHIEVNNGNGWVESKKIYLDFILTVWMHKNIKIELHDIKTKENIARLCYQWYLKTSSRTSKTTNNQQPEQQILIQTQNKKPFLMKVIILGLISIILLGVLNG